MTTDQSLLTAGKNKRITNFDAHSNQTENSGLLNKESHKGESIQERKGY